MLEQFIFIVTPLAITALILTPVLAFLSAILEARDVVESEESR